MIDEEIKENTKNEILDKNNDNINNEELIKNTKNEKEINNDDNNEKGKIVLEEDKKKEEEKIIINNDNIINIENEKNKKEKNSINIININELEEEKKKNDIEERMSVNILTKQFEVHNDDDKYLVKYTDEEKELDELMNEHFNNNSSDEEDTDEGESFPFRIIGDVQKKGEIFGKFNYRYLEIDTVKGIIKRYKSSAEYPRNPLEIIPIRNIKSLKKLPKEENKDGYDLEIIFFVNKGTKQVDKTQVYRVRHASSRNKWNDSILSLWKSLVKEEKFPKINNNKLLFIDDQVGIVQEMKQHNDRCKEVKKGKITLRNFKILGQLGVGGFSTVYKVQHILTDKIYAMKVMNKNYIIFKKYLHYVVSEFEIMKSLSGFPFVLDLHYCFQSANYLYLIIDYCPNGDFTHLKCINNFKLFLAEVILAFEHIHRHNIVYRDLKLENIILDEEGHIKICDFNLAKSGITKGKKALSFCGSPMYLSPEMVTRKGVDQRCDIYGIGLIIYELISGFPPYLADDFEELYKDIEKNKINFDVPSITGDIKDLLTKILVADPEKRISLEEIKKHPFFKDISFLKVYKKQYGPILTKKRENKEKRKPILIGEQYFQKKDENSQKEKEKMKKVEEKDKYVLFKQEQLKLDANNNYTFLDGKVSVKAMKKDQKREMKNYVREFYFVKKEDAKMNDDFHLTINSNLNTKDFKNKK